MDYVSTMAGVRDVNVIDLVAHDPDLDEYLLVIDEDRPWGSAPDQDLELREKINTYAGFIVNGDLARTYPETRGSRVRVQLECGTEPTEPFADIISHAATKLAGVDVRLVVNVVTSPN